MVCRDGVTSVQVQVRGKNLQVTPALQQYVAQKLSHLDRFSDHLGRAQVTLSVVREHHICEVTIPFAGSRLLRAEERSEDMYASVDKVVDKLQRQIEKYRTRLLARRTAGVGEAAAAPGPADGVVVRTKRYPVKPMTVDEAILQMELLGHDFFIFADADTDRVSVVYRRWDGNFGLIEPET
jgi:putative sigma-54 modulation protein